MRILVFSAMLLLSGCAGPGGPPVATGEAAPDFELRDVDGATVRLSDMRGEPVLLELFGVRCGTCMSEMSQLALYWDEFGAPGRVGILSVDFGHEYNPLGARAESEVRAWRADYRANWTFAWDPEGNVTRHYDVPATPTSYLIDAEGRLAWSHDGYVRFADLKSATDRVLEAAG